MIGHKNPSISQNLTLSLVLVVGILSMMFIGISYYQISRNTEWQLEKTADRYINSIAGTLEVPLWDMDRENINSICSYYIQNDWVVMVKLTSMTGEVMFQKSIINASNQNRFINRTREILYGGEVIGHVEIVFSSSEFYKEKLKFLKGIVAGLLVCCAGLLFFTGLLLKKFIKEPIAVLGKIAESYSRGEYHPDINITPYKEFDTIVSVLFKMGDTIEAQMNELRKAEESLIEHRDRLEETVAERTMALEAANKNLQNEIKNRQQAQEALRMNEQRLVAILRSSPVGIGLVVEDRINWTNQTLCLMAGYQEGELLNKDIAFLFKEPEEYGQYLNALTKSISESAAISVEAQWVRKDGSVFDCNIRVYPHDINVPSKGQIVAVADISDRKASEQALREKDRLQGVLELSGAVSHEMTQPLMGAMGHFDLLKMSMQKDDPNIQRIEKITMQLARMSTITKKLMKISAYQTKDYLNGQIVDLSINTESDPDKEAEEKKA